MQLAQCSLSINYGEFGLVILFENMLWIYMRYEYAYFFKAAKCISYISDLYANQGSRETDGLQDAIVQSCKFKHLNTV